MRVPPRQVRPPSVQRLMSSFSMQNVRTPLWAPFVRCAVEERQLNWGLSRARNFKPGVAMARVDVARLRGNPGGDVKELARGVFAQAPVVPTGVLCLADHGHVVGSFGATTTLATLNPRARGAPQGVAHMRSREQGSGVGFPAAGATGSIFRCYPACPTIARAARSAMSMVGALVLPEMMVGIADASTTRRPATRCTRQSVSSTVAADRGRPWASKGPHRTGAYRMKNGCTEFTGRPQQVFVAHQLRAG